MTGPVVIITGANNGIGYYITKSLLENEFRVAGFDLSGENLSALHSRYPARIRYYCCDVTDETLVNRAVVSVIREWHRIDILVNNACFVIFKPFEQKSLDYTRKEFEVNYFGYLKMIKAVLPHMNAQGYGIIHNISSGISFTGFPGIYGYASTKGAIESLTRTLAIELDPFGIAVNLLHPPLTNTKSAASLGIPVQMMRGPADVGHRLAGRIWSTKTNITPDFKTALGLFANRHLSGAIGKLLTKMVRKLEKDTLFKRACG